MYGDTCGMNLYECRVGEISSFAVGCDGCGAVATHSVGAEEVCVAVATGRKYDCVGSEAFEFAGHEVFGDDTACASVDHNYVVHLVAVEALDFAEFDLAV